MYPLLLALDFDVLGLVLLVDVDEEVSSPLVLLEDCLSFTEVFSLAGCFPLEVLLVPDDAGSLLVFVLLKEPLLYPLLVALELDVLDFDVLVVVDEEVLGLVVLVPVDEVFGLVVLEELFDLLELNDEEDVLLVLDDLLLVLGAAKMVCPVKAMISMTTVKNFLKFLILLSPR